MTGRADAWFPFYVSDYLRDTRHLTTEQHGAYLLLLMDCWSKRGPLPDNDAALATIVGRPVRAWRQMRPVIEPYFTVSDGQWVSPRMMREIERSKEISEKRKEAGKRGGRPSNSGGKSKANGLQVGSQTGLQTETHARVASPSPSEIQGSVSNETGASAPTDPDKKAWREAVDVLTAGKRMSEANARKFFGQLLSRNKLQAKDLLPALAQCVANGTEDPAAYVRKAAERLSDRRSGGSAPPLPLEPDEPINWARRLQQFRGPDRVWVESMWGPRPGQPGCLCPAELLEQA